MAQNTLEILLKVSGAGKATAEIKKLDGTLDKVGTSATGTGGKFNALKANLASTGTELLKMAGVAAGIVGGLTAVGLAVKKLGDDFVDYAFQVQDFGRIIGATPEEASKLIQVADDVRVSVESLTTAMRSAIQR